MNSPKQPVSQRTSTEIREDGAANYSTPSDWVEALRRNKMSGIVSWLLDAGRPIAFISSQLLYMGRPFLGVAAERMARILESEDAADAFVDDLLYTARIGSSGPRDHS